MKILLPLLPLLCLLLAPSAQGEVRQPDGTVVPVGTNLRNYLRGEGEDIDVVAQAATTPRTFNPLCDLTFKVIARGGGFRNSFGWYNVTGKKPERSDLHEFLTCTDAVGTERTLEIADHPAYRGGEIGFFMATPQRRNGTLPIGAGDTMPGNCVKFDEGGPVDSTLGFLYFSEPQWNDDNVEGQENAIHLLIYDSGVFGNAFYFGWEDLHNLGSNDNDFEDLLTRVEGIVCSGGGGECDTGGAGVCGAGTMQCRDGKLACVQQVEAREETCNGLDDDCDGEVDNGATCPGDQICHRGACVPRCYPGEFACFHGTVCDEGVCVEPACKGVRCSGGSVCEDGECKAPCDGVTCPAGKVCRLGSCVDPCEGVSCDPGQVCDGGACRPMCGCLPCEGGLSCASDGRCVEPGCEDLSCEAGTHCRAGVCVDDCDGAVCPGHQVCRKGACRDPGDGGEGGDGGGAGGAGGSSSGTGGSGGLGGGSTPGAGEKDLADDAKAGCGCSAGEGGTGLGLLALALLLRRRVEG